jgi:hypothetical protein
MNKEQFIFWLKGFAKAVNEEGPTPKQWETIVSELDKIRDCPDYGSPIDGGVVLTVSSGSSGTIIATPGYGSITYNPSTSTAYGYPSGSAWHYTNTLVHGTLHATAESKEYFGKQKDKETKSNQLELDLD